MMSLETIMAHLPPLRPDKVWAIRIFPGGRSEWRQVEPGQVMSREKATMTPGVVIVSPEDGVEILADKLYYGGEL